MNGKYLIGLLIVILVAALPLFGHLSELPMQRWDESRLAVKAYEMSETGDWLVPSLHWKPDMGSTKPPLNIWVQVISIKIFGVNELATRLPSAIAALLTCILLYWFLTKKFKNQLAGIAAAMILLVSEVYVNLHGVRTGDYDSLLTLFTTAYVLLYYLYLTEKKSKYLLLTGIMVVGATMTKCVQGLMFLPALLIMTIVFKQFKTVISNKYLYINIGLFLLIVGGYYLLREQYNPGFLDATYRNELGGRYLKVLELHDYPWYYYLQHVYERDTIWMLLAVFGMNLMVISRDKDIRRLSAYLSCIIVFYTVVISASQTKLFWYIIPNYPLCTILAALVISSIYLNLKQHISTNKYMFYGLPIATALFFYSMDYAYTIDRTFKPEFNVYDPEKAMISYLHNEGHGAAGIDSSILLYEEWAQDFVWYYHKLNTKYTIEYNNMHGLTAGDKVVVHNPDVKTVLKERFDVKLLEQYYAVDVYRIIEKKQNEITADTTSQQL